MSKWTDVRDSIVDALHVDDVTEEVKQGVLRKSSMRSSLW